MALNDQDDMNNDDNENNNNNNDVKSSNVITFLEENNNNNNNNNNKNEQDDDNDDDKLEDASIDSHDSSSSSSSSSNSFVSHNDNNNNNNNNNENKENNDDRRRRLEELLEQVESDYYLPPTPDEIPFLLPGQRVIAIGDIHGNLDRLCTCLQAGSIINVNDDDDDDAAIKQEEKHNWCGGNTIVVQVGDVLDRGTQELECLLLLCKLGRQAQAVGGAVIMLWGNHEICNASAQFECITDYTSFGQAFGPILDITDSTWKHRYSTGHYFSACYQKDIARWRACEPGGILSKPLLSKLKVAVKVGRTVFVHGGMTDTILKKEGGITAINQRYQKWISTKVDLEDCLADLSDDDMCRIRNIPRQHDIYRYDATRRTSPDSDNFCWMRDFSCPANQTPLANEQTHAVVKAVLQTLQVDRIVVGHTTQAFINSVYDGTLWRIDAVLNEVLEIAFNPTTANDAANVDATAAATGQTTTITTSAAAEAAAGSETVLILIKGKEGSNQKSRSVFMGCRNLK